MLARSLLAVLLLALGCRHPEHPEQRSAGRPLRVPEPVAVKQAEEDSPQQAWVSLKRFPHCQPDSILSEELNWLRGDLQAVIEFVVSPKGRAESSRVVDITPRDVRVAQEFGDFYAKCLQKAKFRIPPHIKAQSTVRITVRFHASRTPEGDRK